MPLDAGMLVRHRLDARFAVTVQSSVVRTLQCSAAECLDVATPHVKETPCEIQAASRVNTGSGHD